MGMWGLPRRGQVAESVDHEFTVDDNAQSIEIVQVIESAKEPDRKPWRAYEIWTGNTIYGLDKNLVCIEVMQRDGNTIKPNSQLLGARVIGSEVRKGPEVC